MRLVRTVLLAAVLALVASQSAAQTIDPRPLQIVDDTHRAILKIQQNSATLDAAAEARIAAVLDPVTHFFKIAETILELYAEFWTIGEWRQLSGVLGKLIRHETLWKMRPYRVERYEPVSTETVFRTVVVKVRAHSQGEAVPITYWLDREDGAWFIVGYAVDGVNVVDHYQEHYHALFKQGFLDPIIRQLERDISAYATQKTGQ